MPDSSDNQASHLDMESNFGANIKVIGVGGGGGNTVRHMLDTEVEGVSFVLANTDVQALSGLGEKALGIQIGCELTKGLGAGANPDVGRNAALEDREAIVESLRGADMVFITAGMGGGTGTGAAPIVAQIAREMNILTVGVVSKPFSFEGAKRMRFAEEGIKELKESVDSLITIPNDQLLKVMGRNVSLVNAFATANDVLKDAVQGIADLIVRPGMINVDFADVCTVMSEMGMAMMGTGTAKGDSRAEEATIAAIQSPLLDSVDLKGARGILINITGGMDLGLGEFSEVGQIVQEYASEDATIVVGTVIDMTMEDDIKVTVVATGFDPIDTAPVKEQSNQLRGHNAPHSKHSRPSIQKVNARPQMKAEPTVALSETKRASTAYPQSAVGYHRASHRPSAPPVVEQHQNAQDSDDYLDIPTFLRRNNRDQ